MNGGTCSLFVLDDRSGCTFRLCYVVKKLVMVHTDTKKKER